jgi:hemerythrin
MTILWRQAMAIDNGIIDHDHQVLLSIINDFCELRPNIDGQAELQRTLAKLHHYANYHFVREEQLQAAANFPQGQGHSNSHKQLIRRLDDISMKVAALGPIEVVHDGDEDSDLALIDSDTMENHRQTHDEVTSLLRSWMVDHILKSDLPMKPYVAAMKPHANRMHSLWSYKPALLMPNFDTPRAAKHALLSAKAWMPAGYRNEKLSVSDEQHPVLPTVPVESPENPVLARMRRGARRLEMTVELDPRCRDFNSRALSEALVAWRNSLAAGGGLRGSEFALQGFLDNTALFERIEHAGGTHHYTATRTGLKFTRIFGDIDGRVLEDVVAPRILERWKLLLDGVLDYNAPLRIVGLAHAFGRDDLVVEGLLAPFHRCAIKQVLAVVSYEMGMA